MNLNTDAFSMFSIYHINILFYLIFFGYFFIHTGTLLPTLKEKHLRICFGIAIPALYMLEIAFSIFLGYYDFFEFLPLHLCSIMVVLAPIALLTKRQEIFEILYFYGTFGAFTAILFPALSKLNYYDLRIGFFMLKHGLLFIAPLYLIIVNKMRPTLKGMIRAITITIVFCIFIVYPANYLSGYNYIYLMGGPRNTPLAAIEATFGYGGYIAFLCTLSVVVPALFYLPFAFTKAKNKYKK